METYLPTVDFKEACRHLQVEMSVFLATEIREDVPCGHGVDAFRHVLGLALELPSHGVRLTAARLTVSEARCHAAIEDCAHQRTGSVSWEGQQRG